MKKLLLVLVVLMTLFVSVPAIACHGPGCNDVTVDADAGVTLINSVLGSYKNSDLAGGYSVASVDAEAMAHATGEDYTTYEWDYIPGHWTQDGEAGWYQKQHGGQNIGKLKFFPNGHPQPQDNNEWVFVRGIYIPGHFELVKTFHNATAEAGALMKIYQLPPKVCIITTGLKETGLSFTIVHTKAELIALGKAWAEGTPNCPQTAIIDLSGELSAVAYGNSGVEHPNGQSFAVAGGVGSTTAEFEGYKSDVGKGYAEVCLFGTVKVEQNVFASSFVNEAGTYSSNFAMVQGGYAKSMGDLDLTGLTSEGMVVQSGLATNGAGAFAYGSSMAQFSGAEGAIFSGRCGDVGIGAGMAVVSGYNSVVTSPNGISATSFQTGFATTAGVGGLR